MAILIDSGNSRIKCAYDIELENGKVEIFEGEGRLAACAQWLQQQTQNLVCVANVNYSIGWQDWQRAAAGHRLCSVTKQPRWLAIDYDHFENFGVDRWLALYALKAFPKDKLIVSVGTAITVDALSASGDYLGGSLMLSPQEYRRCFNERLPGLSMSAEKGLEAVQRGFSTHECSAAGEFHLYAAGLSSAISCYDLKASALKIITGGGALEIMGYLAEDLDYQPWLVLQGIKHWLEQALQTGIMKMDRTTR